jgi:CheY-like chemotaxis protein
MEMMMDRINLIKKQTDLVNTYFYYSLCYAKENYEKYHHKLLEKKHCPLSDHHYYLKFKNSLKASLSKQKKKQPSQAINILTIDDDIRTCQALALSLPQYKHYLALSGENGLKILKNNKIDIVLIDYQMQGIDGLKACQMIRKKKKSIGIILFTGKPDILPIINCHNFGADMFVFKPFDLDYLEKLIEALCKTD